jgi:hypothetical protein
VGQEIDPDRLRDDPDALIALILERIGSLSRSRIWSGSNGKIRAATFSPSPKMSSLSAITSPRSIPTLNSIRFLWRDGRCVRSIPAPPRPHSLSTTSATDGARLLLAPIRRERVRGSPVSAPALWREFERLLRSMLLVSKTASPSPIEAVMPLPSGGPGTFSRSPCRKLSLNREEMMNGLIYLIGLIVVILAILSFFGLR